MQGRCFDAWRAACSWPLLAVTATTATEAAHSTQPLSAQPSEDRDQYIEEEALGLLSMVREEEVVEDDEEAGLFVVHVDKDGQEEVKQAEEEDEVMAAVVAAQMVTPAVTPPPTVMIGASVPPDVTPGGERNLKAELYALKKELELMQTDLTGREVALGIREAGAPRAAHEEMVAWAEQDAVADRDPQSQSESLEASEAESPKLAVSKSTGPASKSTGPASKSTGPANIRRRRSPKRLVAASSAEDRDTRGWEEVRSL
jgi:hypothetical protein